MSEQTNNKYTSAVGTKFHPDGSLRYFPGNTIVSMTLDEPTYSELVWAQDEFKRLPFASKFSFLPPSSFHMTVFELLCDQVREPAYWSNLIPLDAPLEETDTVFRTLLEDVNFPDRIEMQPIGPGLGLSILIRLRPANDANADLLQAFRDAVADKAGVRFPNHDSYRYHITLAYNIEHLSEEEKAAFELVAQQVNDRIQTTLSTIVLKGPKFVKFHDMGDFREDLDRGGITPY